jgi:aspartyl-tRNA synthetase
MNAGNLLYHNHHKHLQLLMVGGMDKYFQIVKCSVMKIYVQTDNQSSHKLIVKWLCGTRRYLNVFEGLTRHLLKEIKGIEVDKFPRMTYEHNENLRK